MNTCQNDIEADLRASIAKLEQFVKQISNKQVNDYNNKINMSESFLV